jgi:hypothetical protein
LLDAGRIVVVERDAEDVKRGSEGTSLARPRPPRGRGRYCSRMNETRSERLEILLVEYQKAQDSAEHHDALVWEVTTLNWIGSAVLMGFVLSGIGSHPSASHKLALLSIAFVGIMLSTFVWIWARQFGRFRNEKYSRCKAIEAELGMGQHSSTQWPGSATQHRWWLPLSQRRHYSVLMVAFLATWLVLVVIVIVD